MSEEKGMFGEWAEKYDPAFAFVAHDGEHTTVSGGLTKRDYFAAKAMQTLMSTHPSMKDRAIAIHAYQMAEAMMKERAK